MNDNTSAANTITINSDLIVGPGSGAGRHLILNGVNAGTNTFAGSIGNGTGTYEGVSVAVTKSVTGNWRITSDNNTFTGAITFSPTGKKAPCPTDFRATEGRITNAMNHRQICLNDSLHCFT